MNRKDFLEKSKKLNGCICGTVSCPKCGCYGVNFKDEVLKTGGKCGNCGLEDTDGHINDWDFCGCED